MPDRDDLTPPEDDSTATVFPPDRAPQRIGPYKILEKIGEGGMGVVYLAEQEAPLRRRVALKVIKPGMDSKQVLARFEAERQALALMNHPGVAKVFDAGSTPEGRPYFVMEHVAGLPITDYCDKHLLTNRQRLELFIQVCDAIQHAHQKGIIHRDIKPSNVLVTLVDGTPHPKVIDFGVAKATQQQLTEESLFTQQGVLVGTPEYMSPEQAEMSALDIDTRSDVYSLGVLLYELLVGALPFDPSTLRRAGFDEIRRKIREEDPPRPSARLATLGDRSTESARRRRTHPNSLRRELLGDLDWITMHALEKDRARRYRFPSDLAEDIQRHLRDEPVLAHAPSAGYRARKFVRRHRLGVAAAAVMVVGLAAGTVGSTVGLVRARRAEAQARQEAQAKGQVADFLKNLFKVSNPSEARGNTISAREILDKAAGTIDTRLKDQPEVRAELTSIMGQVYRNLGLLAPAESLFTRALDIRRRALGPEHPDTLRSTTDLASVYNEQGRYPEAERLLLEALDIEKRVLGPENRLTLLSTHRLATAYFRQGRYPEAEVLFSQVLEIEKRVLGPEDHGTLATMVGLAAVYASQNRFPEAAILASQTLEIQRRVLSPEHPDTLLSMNNLANIYKNQGRFPEAERLHLDALEIQKRVLGPEHPDTLSSMNNLANVYMRQGRYPEAERLFSRLIEMAKRILGTEHQLTIMTMLNVADVCALQGDHAKAMSWLRQAVESGYRDVNDLSEDTALNVLHGPEFDALLEQVRRKTAAARAPAGDQRKK